MAVAQLQKWKSTSMFGRAGWRGEKEEMSQVSFEGAVTGPLRRA